MVFIENAEYKLNGSKQELPGFDKKYHNIVDYILKITEEIWEQRAVWVIYDTYGKDIPIHSGAGTAYGLEPVVKGTIKTLASFPDRKMGGEAVIWSKIGINHFYSSHRIASTATNLGDTDFGKATGKKVFFRTIADCVVTENKIVEEWLVRDNLAIVQQLGFDPIEMAKRDNRYRNGVHNFSRNGKVSIDFNEIPYQAGSNPAADLILALFEKVWKTRQFETLYDYYHTLAPCHVICGETLRGARLIIKYLENLFAAFPDAEVHLERLTCNEKADETEVAARWKIIGTHTGEGFFGTPSGKYLIIPVITHFTVKDGKISEEWMVFDAFDALCQIHADTITPNTEGGQGIKKGAAFVQSEVENKHLSNKKMVHDFLQSLTKAGQDKQTVSAILNQYLSEEITLDITKPFDTIHGIEGYQQAFWQPLMAAFPDLENQPYILVGGDYEGRENVSVTGNFIGTFKNEWLSIPPTNQPMWLRYAAHFFIKDAKIQKAWFFFDILDVMRQAGFHFIPNRGIEWVPPIPMTGDGIVLYPTDPAESQKSLDLTNAMLNGLGSYDGKTLDSMGQERFWDVQNMMWYGPSGIGTTRGLKGFQDNHQIPFLTGFPDRGITPKVGNDYFAQMGDGNYSCDFGFPAMYGTHNGDAWLGLKATGKKITLRVVDYWRREGDRLKENWVFIDIVDVLEQLGVDVFQLLQQKINKKSATLSNHTK